MTNRDATIGPQPYVKWSHEPPRAQDVPGAIGAGDPPRGAAAAGPGVRLDPDGRLECARPTRTARSTRPARGHRPGGPDAGRARASSRAVIESARNPVLIAGPDIDASGGWDAAVRWPRSSACRCGRARHWRHRIGFPESHPNFMGVLPPAIGPLSDTLKGHDLVLVVGSSCSLLPVHPGPLLPEGASGRDHSDPARRRARRWATRSSATSRSRLRAGGAGRRVAPRRPGAAAGAGGAAAGRPDERLGGDGGPRRRLAGGRDRGGRDPLERVRAAQPAAALAPRQLLPAPAAASASGSRRRSACSSPSPTGRWSACSARARRSTGSPCCGRRPLQGAGHVPGRAQRGVHDPQVVLGARAGQRGSGARASRGSTPRRWREPTACRRRVSDREQLTEALRAAIAVDDGPRLIEARVASGMWWE